MIQEDVEESARRTGGRPCEGEKGTETHNYAQKRTKTHNF